MTNFIRIRSVVSEKKYADGQVNIQSRPPIIRSFYSLLTINVRATFIGLMALGLEYFH